MTGDNTPRVEIEIWFYDIDDDRSENMETVKILVKIDQIHPEIKQKPNRKEIPVISSFDRNRNDKYMALVMWYLRMNIYIYIYNPQFYCFDGIQ